MKDDFNQKEVNILTLSKDGQKYVFLYDDHQESLEALLSSFGRYAKDPELNFSWLDMAAFSQKARKMHDNPSSPSDPAM